MKKIFKRCLVLFFLFVHGITIAQNNVQMADRMRSEGKIYVVVAMILVILTGFVIYLVLLDRRIKRLENKLPDENQRTN